MGAHRPVPGIQLAGILATRLLHLGGDDAKVPTRRRSSARSRPAPRRHRPARGRSGQPKSTLPGIENTPPLYHVAGFSRGGAGGVFIKGD